MSGHIFFIERPLSILKQIIVQIKKDTAKATPPRRGIFPEWIFLAETES